MFNGRKVLTVDEALQLFFEEDTEESDLSDTDSLNDNDDEELNNVNDNEYDVQINQDDINILDDESEQEENLKTYEWKSCVDNSSISFDTFSAPSGPVHALKSDSSALDYLRLLLTDDLCGKIMENTNKYAKFCEMSRKKEDRNWIPISDISEIWCFFLILLVMSVVHMPRLSENWPQNPILGNQMIKKFMSRRRFLKIKHYFHVSDRENEPQKNDETFRYSQKLEPMFSEIKTKFQEHFNLC